MSLYHTKKDDEVQGLAKVRSSYSRVSSRVCVTLFVMSKKTWITIGATVGSTLGGMLPSLWGGSGFSTASILLSTAGGFLGIYLGIRCADYLS
jgi:outer membrane lipoprotein SlyB